MLGNVHPIGEVIQELLARYRASGMVIEERAVIASAPAVTMIVGCSIQSDAGALNTCGAAG